MMGRFMRVGRPKKVLCQVSLLVWEGLELLQILLRLSKEGGAKTARRFLAKLNQGEYIT